MINYDFPTGVEDYVHRIGRTGRAGATGIAFTFFTEQDWKYAPDLIKVLEGANQQVPPQVRDIAMRGGGPGFSQDRRGMVNRFDSGGGGSRWDSAGGFGGRGGGFGGRSGEFGMRDNSFGPGGNRGRGYPGPDASHMDVGRGGFGRFGNNNMNGRGFDRDGGRGFDRGGGGRGFDRGGGGGRGFGRGGDGGRFDNKRCRSRSRSPDLVRPRRRRSPSYSRNRSPSYSRSRSRSYSRSRSRNWSRSRSRSPRHSRNRGGHKRGSSYSRSPSPIYERRDRPPRVSGFDIKPPSESVVNPDIAAAAAPETAVRTPLSERQGFGIVQTEVEAALVRQVADEP